MNLMVTYGGALVGLILAALVLVPWWRKGGGGKSEIGKGAAGGRNWKAIAPFVLALLLGVVCCASVGGLIGGAARKAAQGSDQLGDDGLNLLAGAGSQHLVHASPGRVQAGGAMVVIIALVVLWLVGRRGSKQVKRDLGLGLLAGVCLGPTAAMIQLTSHFLLPLLGGIGSPLTGWV